MNVHEHVDLAPYTTFHIGGVAQYFVRCECEEEVREALSFARAQSLKVKVLGAGSNLLVSDETVAGMVLQCAITGIEEVGAGAMVRITAGAGERWDTVVDFAVARGLYGVENLAGIPGTMGGAAVQNIGAYGVELSSTFVSADAIDCESGEYVHILKADAQLAYRTSIFKQAKRYVLVSVTIECSTSGAPCLQYPDLASALHDGVPLTTPGEIAMAVRRIRSMKFPHDSAEGTAGSFFKNPVISETHYTSLVRVYPGLPGYVQPNGMVKISLAWILDHAVHLKGFSRGKVRLYEKQPLIIVATRGARARDVDAFASEIADRVMNATGITIEREVESFE